jgi:2,4-dienoyl-CoA reductase-like NADH-dependent reductase (Old Yellow Enzyme family)/FAD/FMN-containing dehydrogenase
MKRTGSGPEGYFAQALYTTLNSVLYTLSFGKYLWLEGRRSGKHWHNWTHGQYRRVEHYLLPVNEQEIIEAVRRHPRLRVVGAGHSFNAGVLNEVILSLDAHTGIVEIDKANKRVRVRAGTRVRDISRALFEQEKLAVVALPSHDAQSIGGILSTDVHGTGREVGFVSQSVVGLRIVDGQGEVHDVGPEDDLFKAAIGGIGAVGIIAEVTLRCVDAFHIRQQTKRMNRKQAKAETDRLLAEHDHASFYVFPFAKHVQFHTWDHTQAEKSFFNRLREYINISWAALAAAWIGDLLALTRLLPKLSDVVVRTQRNSNLVMQSHLGFNRTIYHMHQELEFAVSADRVWEVTDHLLRVYEDMYRQRRMPFTIIELRFTPEQALSTIGPGAGNRRHVFVNLVCNQSGAYAEYYRAAEDYMREIDARPHLGKWCETWGHRELARVHGEAFDRFRALRHRHDPEGRFKNVFTDRVFGPIEEGVVKDPIFEPLEFRNLTVKNRIFRSSVGGRFDNYDGTGSYARLNWEERFARGGVGAIVSAFCPVTAEGAHCPDFATIEDDDRIPFWREVGRRVHAHDCKFILQLHHCGRQRDLASVRNADKAALSATNRRDPLNGFPARAMSKAEIQEVVKAFIAGARRAREAGLDGVELHGANGYLLTQFLSSAINDRKDEYGGDVENRARILVEIIEGIRNQVGSDWHVQVKLNAEDRGAAVFPWLKPGNEIEDAIAIARLAVEAGTDAIHVSAGNAFPHPDNPPGPLPLKLLKSTFDTIISEGSKTFLNYLLLRYRPTRWIYGKIWARTQSADFQGELAPLAARIKAAVDVPVIVTGGFQRASLIRRVLEVGQADAVSIARPLVANPDLVQWLLQEKELPPQPCTFCNKCLANLLEHPMGCYELERFEGDREMMLSDVMSVFRPAPWGEDTQFFSRGSKENVRTESS